MAVWLRGCERFNRVMGSQGWTFCLNDQPHRHGGNEQIKRSRAHSACYKNCRRQPHFSFESCHYVAPVALYFKRVNLRHYCMSRAACGVWRAAVRGPNAHRQQKSDRQWQHGLLWYYIFIIGLIEKKRCASFDTDSKLLWQKHKNQDLISDLGHHWPCQNILFIY